MISEFIKQFTDEEIFDKTKQIGRRVFYVPEQLRNLDIELEPYSIGMYLGEQRKEFTPSVALIDAISKKSDKKIFVNKEGEFLFLCGRDLMGKSIVKADVKKGFCLVQNEKDENLGYGRFATGLAHDDRIVVKNRMDKGHFLRRERH